MKEENIEFEFNYASISMQPYSKNDNNSSKLLKNIIQAINSEEFSGEKRIIDRFKNRKTSTKRKLVFISNRFSHEGVRCFGKLALIKNKAPLLWSGKDIVEEIEKEQNKQFIEITNFVIHFNSGADPVIMHEYNHEGPRLSDIEFYLTQVAKEFKLAKKIKTVLHLDTNYQELDNNIQNVFELTVKVKSAYSSRFNWLKILRTLSDDSGFKDVRLQFFYNRIKKNGKYNRNIRGIDFARNIIGWLSKDNKNIKYLDDLKMSYQLNNVDEIIDMDFLKNKLISIVRIPLANGKKYKTEDFTTLVANEFNYYLKTGNSNKE